MIKDLSQRAVLLGSLSVSTHRPHQSAARVNNPRPNMHSLGVAPRGWG